MPRVSIPVMMAAMMMFMKRSLLMWKPWIRQIDFVGAVRSEVLSTSERTAPTKSICLIQGFHMRRLLFMNIIIAAIITGILTRGIYALMASGLPLSFGFVDIMHIAKCPLVVVR